MEKILTNPALWTKIAAMEPGRIPTAPEDQTLVMRGFIDGLKEAGLNGFQAIGLISEIAEAGMAHEKMAAAGFMQNVGHFFGSSHPIDSLWNNTVEPIMQGATEARMQANPFGKWLGDNIYNGNSEEAAAMGRQWIKGNHMDAAANIMSHLPASKFVSAVTPYVIPGLATAAGAKMMGAGWGNSALAGVAGGWLGGQPGVQNLWKPYWDKLRGNPGAVGDVPKKPAIDTSKAEVDPKQDYGGAAGTPAAVPKPETPPASAGPSTPAPAPAPAPETTADHAKEVGAQVKPANPSTAPGGLMGPVARPTEMQLPPTNLTPPPATKPVTTFSQ